MFDPDIDAAVILCGMNSSLVDAVELAEVIRMPALAGARVVAGLRGMGRSVRSVNVMEVPDILSWVRPDELLLTTAYPLRDDPLALEALVPRLAASGLAGLALKPARYIEAIPPAMIEAADRLDFPVIELPPEASFNEIINSVLRVILNAQAARLQRSAAIHDRFTAIVLSGGGLRQIAEALADLIERPVAIVDAQDVVQWQTSPGALDGATGATRASGDAVEDPGVVVRHIQVGGDRYGAILVAAGDAPLGADRLEAVEYAATIAALRQVQSRAVIETDRRFQAVCLEELITGHVADRSALLERAAAFAWDFGLPRAVLLASVESVHGRPFGDLVGSLEEGSVRHRVAEAARSSLGPQAIVWERHREIGALVAIAADGNPATLRAAGTALLTEAARRLPRVVISVGVGTIAVDPLALDRSFHEARHALEIGRWGHGPGQISTFDELGIDRILIRVPAADIEAYCGSMLGALEAYAADHGTSLVLTLDAFLASRNAALAARQLYVHTNTLKNRLTRIEEILAVSLRDPGCCLGLSLALRLRRLPAGLRPAVPGAPTAAAAWPAARSRLPPT